ncbi:MAG: ABC transporter permease [Acidobacteriaceae bacterium]|nr:ABC transporter permease [Acidobacteriaceae bacterium]
MIPLELKHVFRRLARTPGFTIITLVTLAIGIGANSAIFSIVENVLLKPLPYKDSQRLAGVWLTAPGFGFQQFDVSAAAYFTFREENRVFQDIGMYRRDAVTVTGLAEPEQIHAVFVTDGVLPILAVRPLIGRLFNRNDDTAGAPETVLLSNAYWHRKFGGRSSVLGSRLVVDGKARTIIGVLPAHFHFGDDEAALFVPFQLDRGKVFIGNFSYSAVARLKPGISVPQANADVRRMLPMMGQKFQPISGTTLETFKYARFGSDVHPLKQDIVGDIGKVLWVVMGVVGIVLFIACANVANLLLVRAEGRQHEFAVRVSLGATRRRIARELLLESGILALAGGVLGVLLASFVLQLILALKPAHLPRLDQISINLPVLLFTAGIALFGGVFSGIVTVFRYAGQHIGIAIRESGRIASGGRDRHRTRNALVVVQVALALTLLISSGLMIRTFRAMRSVRPGFANPASIQTFRVFIPPAQVKDPEHVAQMLEDMDHRLASIPGVKSVAIADGVTMSGVSDNDPVMPEDHVPVESNVAALRRYKLISPGYFQTMGNPLIAGRDLSWNDIHENRPVVLVSENLARLYWREPANAIGKRVRESLQSRYREVIGVVADEHDDGPDRKAPYIAYWPFRMQNFFGEQVSVERNVAFAVRTSRAGSASFLEDLRRSVWSVNADIAIAEPQTMEQIFNKSTARTSFTLVMLAVAAGMALLLGLVGIYGVVSYVVSQRTREIGIRMALGATHNAVQRMFVGYALSLVVTGAVAGISAAAAVTRTMRALLFQTSPLDPVTYGGVSLILLLAALLASYFPARRATTVDPMEALRVE